MQSPLALSDDSEPEPDLAVVPAGDYRRAHPAQALLVIEVSETSLEKDRGVKTALYAAAGIPEFWIVSIPAQTIEVHRQPSAGRYTTIVCLGRGDAVAPAAHPAIRIAVGNLFD